ncbi:MAG: carboxylating nicotinate-nucleotide diphosphorylase [Bdellovibrionales bacterium]|nr:carboxylating nicotinate-nucleotide diphosphorylase [Bdellovibrionales bacterium]
MTPEALIAEAFKEDLPGLDLTTDHLETKNIKGYAFLVAKSDLKLSGSLFFEKSIHHLSPQSQIRWFFKDGDTVLNQQKIASIHGNLLEILKAERVALNFLGHLSGVATLTYRYVSACGNSPLKILDTRKTLPLYREWEKKAVLDGGGVNHRMNLSDSAMIKENHIRVAGSIRAAVEQVRKGTQAHLTIEVTTLDEVRQAVEMNPQRLLLDNMNDDLLRQSLELIPESIETEASGNMTIERVRTLSQIEGLDFVSVGALTHSAPVADVSLLFLWS